MTREIFALRIHPMDAAHVAQTDLPVGMADDAGQLAAQHDRHGQVVARYDAGIPCLPHAVTALAYVASAAFAQHVPKHGARPVRAQPVQPRRLALAGFDLDAHRLILERDVVQLVVQRVDGLGQLDPQADAMGSWHVVAREPGQRWHPTVVPGVLEHDQRYLPAGSASMSAAT